MSIYATLSELKVQLPTTYQWQDLRAQAALVDMDYTGPGFEQWLPAPVDPQGDTFAAGFFRQTGSAPMDWVW